MACLLWFVMATADRMPQQGKKHSMPEDGNKLPYPLAPAVRQVNTCDDRRHPNEMAGVKLFIIE